MLLSKRKKADHRPEQRASQSNNNEKKLDISLDKNKALIRKIFKNDETLIIREFQNKGLRTSRCCIAYIEGMVNTELINENIMQPVLCVDLSENIRTDNLLEELKNKVIVSNNVVDETDINKMISSIVSGDTLFLLDGYDQALIISSRGWASRSISEPESSKVIRGPREGFTESIIVNLTLLRRRIKNPELKFKFKDIGVRTNTKVCISYIEGLAQESIIRELEKRLDDIQIDGILDSGYIQELIRDAPFSPFETVGSNERPDVTAGKLLEGRIALFVDGSPFVLTVPYVVGENFQSNEDYYNNYILASINRLLRGFTAVITIAIPSIYLAVVTYHQEMLPTPLLLSIIASRQDVPIPTSASLFLMLVIFDIIREATTRMPTNISQAVSIIGTIVLGQAAIEARLVSAPVLIVTALTGVTTLMNMNFLGAAIIFRNIILLGTSVMGIYGFFMCFVLMYLHLMSLRSFGVPYMMSVTKAKNHEGQDAWIRAPWWSMTLRPKIIGVRNLVRESTEKSKGK